MGDVDVLRETAALNAFLKRLMWIDFEVAGFRDRELTVVGSIDPSAGPDVEVHFDQVFYLCLPVEWKTDTSHDVFELLQDSEAIQTNSRCQIEVGNYLFRFKAEGRAEACLIAARDFRWSANKPLERLPTQAE